MAKPLEEWTPDELRTEIVRLTDELARRTAAPSRASAGRRAASTSCARARTGCAAVAWDETFTQEMVEDELSIHERKAGQELGPLERERLRPALAERVRPPLPRRLAA